MITSFIFNIAIIMASIMIMLNTNYKSWEKALGIICLVFVSTQLLGTINEVESTAPDTILTPIYVNHNFTIERLSNAGWFGEIVIAQVSGLNYDVEVPRFSKVGDIIYCEKREADYEHYRRCRLND